MPENKSLRSRLNKLTAGLALGASVLVAGSAAADDTANVNVSATVTANCTITSGGLAFGAYDPVDVNASADLDQTGTVTVTCTDGFTTGVTLGQGANADVGSSDAIPARRMSDGGTAFLSYQLFSEGTRTTVWGNDAATDVVHTGDGTAQVHTIFGRVDGGQNVPAGSYTDTVVATVTF